MTSDQGAWLSSFLKVLTGGLVGSLAATFLSAYWEDRREQRGTLQTLVVAWHGVYQGGHRDRITEWFLSPDGVALRRLPPAERRPALVDAFLSGDAPAPAILAVAGFFRTIDICVRDERCDQAKAYAAFSQPAREFHDLLGPLLRDLDCNQGYSGAEDPILKIAKRYDAVPPAPERCNSL